MQVEFKPDDENMVFRVSTVYSVSTGGNLFSSHESRVAQGGYSSTRFFKVWHVCSEGLHSSCFSHHKHQVNREKLFTPLVKKNALSSSKNES